MSAWVLVMIITINGDAITVLQVEHRTQASCEAMRVKISGDLATVSGVLPRIKSQGCYQRP